MPYTSPKLKITPQTKDHKIHHWSLTAMHLMGQQQFNKRVQRYRLAHANHDIHFLAREKEDWLLAGCQSLLDGTYIPRFIKRRYFKDETVDQLSIPDRIFQSLLLKQLKTTFARVINPHCYHIEGPQRRRLASVLQERRLSLSRKKTRMGLIEKGFHFLGIDYYPGTRPQDKKAAPAIRWHLHRRTLRKAREQVKQMVSDGFSALQISAYLLRWARWWVHATRGHRICYFVLVARDIPRAPLA